MQYDADTPKAYLAMLQDDWRRASLLQVRAVLLEVADVKEGIGFGMLQYCVDDDVFAHLNAQKGHVGVYLGDLDRLDPTGNIRTGASFGKSCLRMRKSDSVDVAARLIAVKSALFLKRPDT